MENKNFYKYTLQALNRGPLAKKKGQKFCPFYLKLIKDYFD